MLISKDSDHLLSVVVVIQILFVVPLFFLYEPEDFVWDFFVFIFKLFFKISTEPFLDKLLEHMF